MRRRAAARRIRRKKSSHDLQKEEILSKKKTSKQRDSDVAEYIEKYNKYEADYVRRVKAKYFSRKSLHGGIIFDKETLVDDEVIRASKVPPTKSFTDASCLGEEHKSSASAADPSANAPNRKPQSRKNV